MKKASINSFTFKILDINSPHCPAAKHFSIDLALRRDIKSINSIKHLS